MNDRNYRITTNEQYCEAIKTIMRQKGVKFVDFDRKTYDENALTKNQMPWCVLFDEFICTVSVPSLMTEEELQGLDETEKTFIKNNPNCIVLATESDGGMLRYDLFNGMTHCHSTEGENSGEEDYQFLFEEVYSYLWDGGMEDEESDIWLKKNGFVTDIDPERLLYDIKRAAGAVAQAQGMNVTYCESMDLGEVFPAIARFALNPDDLGKDEEDILGTLHFVSDEGSIFPKEMKAASVEQFKEYFDQHYKELLVTVRNDVDHYLAEFQEEDAEQNERFHPTECPYCGCETVLPAGKGCFLCTECEREFTVEDYEFEVARHHISACLSASEPTEEEPLPLDITLGDRHITGGFHDFDAKIWFYIEGQEEPVNIDEFSLDEVKTIAEKIQP